MPLGVSLKSLTIHFLCVVLVSFSVNYWKTSFWEKDKQPPVVESIRSHAFCYGNNNTDRRCRFKNLCFRSDTKDFVFFDDHLSVREGIPSDRFNPSLVDLSSVSDHNRYYFNYIEVPSSSLKLIEKELKLIFIPETTIIFGRFKPDNLMHLLHDDLLPLYATVQLLTPDTTTFNVMFFDEWHDFFDFPHLRYAREIYGRLIKAKNLFTSDSFTRTLVCFQEARVGLVRTTTWYDYGFRKPQGPLPLIGQQTKLPQVLDSILHELRLFSKKCSSRHVLLLSRKRNRLIMNEHELLKTISSLIQHEMPVISLRMEGYNNFTELVAKIRCAKILIGMHGSGLALSAFLPTDAGVLELFPYAVDPESYTPYKTLCKLRNIAYISWANEYKENTITHSDYPASLGGINHLPPGRVRDIIESTRVRPHLCCDDPEWLFRINQDTVVDVNTFSQSFSELLSEISAMSRNQTSKRYLTPGRVSSVSCSRNGVSLSLNWTEPWNLRLMALTQDDLRSIQYEILVQSRHSKDRFLLFSKDKNVTFKVSGSESLIWLRCHLHNLSGPFNNEPVHC